jgi:inosine-uridine nucleoside N-ribohydrolase
VSLVDDGQSRFPQTIKGEDDTPDATRLIREVLSRQPDKSVRLVVVGFSTNLARLLESKGDDVSPLDGRALVEQKVELLSMMAGRFDAARPADFKEYNVHIDLAACEEVFENWPTPIVVSGFEIGLAIPYPATSIEHDFNYVAHHPLKEAYELYMQMPYDRPTWDLTSVLYAVRPNRDYFGISEGGEISIVDGGITNFKPGGHSRHRIMTVTPEQIARVREALILLSSQPPRTVKKLD